MKNKFLYRIIMVLLLCTFLAPEQVEAKDIQSVRVGLKSLYEGKSNITIKNRKIGLGYSLDYNFTNEVTLDSENGFKFTPDTGYYYILNKEFKKYQDAKVVAETLSQLGVNAYPAVNYQKSWQVYLGGSSDQSKTKEQYNKVKGKLGFTYSSIQGDNQYRMKVSGDNDILLIDVNDRKAFPSWVAMEKNSSGVAVIDLGLRQYRGRLEIGRYDSGSLTAVNIIPVEEYLYGVVPCEMNSTWPLEALKVQAVCARSFAIRTAGYRTASNADHAYSMEDSTGSQVYKGYSVEKITTSQAVKETSGETVSFHNQIISPYYFSTSGGKTESIEDVWNSGKPYLRSVPDLYELEPERGPWIAKLKRADLVSKIVKRGINLGTITNIFPEITTDSGRIFSLKIQGSKASTVLQEDEIRTVLNLDSTKFKIVEYGDTPDLVAIKGSGGIISEKISNSYIIDGNFRVQKASKDLDQYIVISADNLTNYPRVTPENKETIYFAGQGYGHGIGMSQSGAKGMAAAGFTYQEILKYYYKGVEIR